MALLVIETLEAADPRRSPAESKGIGELVATVPSLPLHEAITTDAFIRRVIW
jgi:hypothetical protein